MRIVAVQQHALEQFASVHQRIPFRAALSGEKVVTTIRSPLDQYAMHDIAKIRLARPDQASTLRLP